MTYSFSFLLAFFLSQQTRESNFISTPNTRIVTREGDRHQALNGRRPLRLSHDIKNPTPITVDSIQDVNQLKRVADEYLRLSKEAGFTSYLENRNPADFVAGCSSYSSNPSGVPRAKDGLLNGYSTLLLCDGYSIQLKVSDFFQTTSIGAQASLPEEAVPVRGGRMAASFAQSADGRIRQHFTAIGGNLLINLSLHSNGRMAQERGMQQATRITEYVMAHPLSIISPE